MKKKYTIAETFVGAGGSHVGFKQAGFTAIYVNDFDDNFLETLVTNNPELKSGTFIDNRSILDVDGSSILERTKIAPGDLDVMFGGVVCKGFSLAGDRSPNDERSYFYHKQLELVDALKPKISIIENVPGILNAKVLSGVAPDNIKNEVTELWKKLADYKGQKADLRKKDKITKEFEDNGQKLKDARRKMLLDIEEAGYLVPVLKDIHKIYEDMGYKVQHKVLNAAWYGSATKRERIVIVATRKDLAGNFSYPSPTHYSKMIKTKVKFEPITPINHSVKKAVTVGDALKTIDYGNKNDFDNLPMNHSEKTVRRFKYIPQGDSITKHLDELPKDLVISSFYSRGNTMRLANNSPSPTLVPGHSNFPVHPTEHRSITVREAATITGFPNDYIFVGSHTKRCEQVGNAVPPPLARAIAESCIEFLDKLS
ncbi:MAG: DNA cytosine methyltransferase [Candidatus Saccharibacteria bacterium]